MTASEHAPEVHNPANMHAEGITGDSPSVVGAAPITDGVSDLDALEALANAASEGPWEALTDPGDRKTASHHIIDTNDERRWFRAEGEMDAQAFANAQFIAAARNALPALIARLRDAEAKVAAFEADAAQRSEDGRTDWDYEQTIKRLNDIIAVALNCTGNAETALSHLREAAALRAAVPSRSEPEETNERVALADEIVRAVEAALVEKDGDPFLSLGTLLNRNISATLRSLGTEVAAPVVSSAHEVNPDEREALKALLESTDHDWTGVSREDPYGARGDAILAGLAGFRRSVPVETVTTVEEVHRLPIGTLLVTQHGERACAWRAERDLDEGFDWIVNGNSEYRTSEELHVLLPALVFRPDREEGNQ